MVSVCIPLHNRNATVLISKLAVISKRVSVPCEILCIDDGSDEHYRELNRACAEKYGVRYEELPHNIGRSRIRNLLARRATYDFLVFLDDDSQIVYADYLHRYIECLLSSKGEEVIYGGTMYYANPPTLQRHYLHWYYGYHRDARGPEERAKLGWRAFHTNNFAVYRPILLKHPFDERLVHYGYEDTFWAWRIQREGIPIVHIHNPVYHLGFESAETFLHKTAEAMKSLKFLHDRYPSFDTPVTKWNRRLRRWGLNALFIYVVRFAEGWITRQLTRSRPKLWLLDLYKLYLYSRL